MKKTFPLLVVLPLILTACTAKHQTVEVASDNENALWEHSTPIGNQSVLTETPQPNTGWVPNGSEWDVGSPTTSSFSPLPAENFSSSEVEMKRAISHRVVKDDIYASSFESNPEVVRYDRYLLVDSSPKSGQKYLLEQMVTVDMKGVGLSVEQGIWNTLNGTGYVLCSPLNHSVSSLFNLQLPKVHYKFGPVRLRDALQMLAGEAYELTVNDAMRQVCYSPRVGDVPTKQTPKTLVYSDVESM